MSEINKLADTKHSREEHRYDDIINLPHHVSTVHPAMSLHDRAAQFSPFMALTGYEEAVKETARLTEDRMELDENSKSVLDEKLRLVQEQAETHPEITVIYFQADEKKTGGRYVETTGRIKKIDLYEREIILCEGTRIQVDEVVGIEGALLRFMENSIG